VIFIKLRLTKHKRVPIKEKHIELTIFRRSIYFENWFQIVALICNFLTGLFYLLGATSYLLGFDSITGNLFFILGSITMILRPIFNIKHKLYIYNPDKDDGNR